MAPSMAMMFTMFTFALFTMCALICPVFFVSLFTMMAYRWITNKQQRAINWNDRFDLKKKLFEMFINVVYEPDSPWEWWPFLLCPFFPASPLSKYECLWSFLCEPPFFDPCLLWKLPYPSSYSSSKSSSKNLFFFSDSSNLWIICCPWIECPLRNRPSSLYVWPFSFSFPSIFFSW